MRRPDDHSLPRRDDGKPVRQHVLRVERPAFSLFEDPFAEVDRIRRRVAIEMVERLVDQAGVDQVERFITTLGNAVAAKRGRMLTTEDAQRWADDGGRT